MSKLPSTDNIGGLKLASLADTVVFTIKVSPAASRNCFDGIYDGMLKIKLSVAPERGKANQALIEFLSKKMNIKKKFIQIVSGKTSKIKQVSVENINTENLSEKLQAII